MKKDEWLLVKKGLKQIPSPHLARLHARMLAGLKPCLSGHFVNAAGVG